MAAQKGKLFLLSRVIAGSPVTYGSFTSCRATDMTLNGELVDVTTKGANGWRAGLEGAGVKTMSITLEGVFNDSADEEALVQSAKDQSHDMYRLISETGATWVGPFQVTSYGRGGSYNGEETFSVTLESVGEITYTPAA